MYKDPTEFRKRFAAWKDGKQPYEAGLPKYADGKDETVTDYPIPFIKDKVVKLTDAGLATGAVLSTNLLDSIADNADRAGLDLQTALGLATKESTLGNPTDDRSMRTLLSAQRQKELTDYLQEVYGLSYDQQFGQHINRGDIVRGQELINWYIDKNNIEHKPSPPLSTTHPDRKSVIQKAFEFYKQYPDRYNPGQKNYQRLVDKRGAEVMGSPEVQKWLKERNIKKATGRFNRLNPLLNESKLNPTKYKDGKLPGYYLGTEGDNIEELIKRRLEQRSDATTVQRQEPVRAIKRQYGKVVDPELVERKQQQQPVIKQGNTYKVKPRPQTFAGRVAQVTGNDWIKTDATSAGIGIGLQQIPAIGPVLSAAWGAPDFGYDLNESVHNLTDQESHANTAMSGLALLPYVRGGLKMLEGKTYIDRLRNVYNQWMTRYNTNREINKALKAARISDAAQDGTSGIFDEYAKQWFNNEVSFIRPFKSNGGKGNTVGDVIDYNLGLWGGREKPLSELTENQRYRLAEILSKDERFPRGTRIIHMDDSGPQPVNNVGFVPKDASNSNSVWNSSLQGQPEIWWNRGTPYYDARGYRSAQDIPRTIISDIEDLKQHGVSLDGLNVIHGPGIVPFQSIHYGIQPNPFGWFDRIKFIGQ